MPLISVIVPSYGVPDLLERTAESVLKQTLTDLELIVVDDNDPETENRKATEELMAKLSAKDPRVVYIKHEHNKNGSAARNTGLRAAQGKYISFLDSDDEYVETRLERCVKALEEADDPKFQGVYTGCELRVNGQTYRKMQNVGTGNFMVDYLALRFNLFTGSNIFITREAADALNGFDEAFLRHQDVEYIIRFFEQGFDIIGIPDILVIKNVERRNSPSPEKFRAIKEQFLEKFRPTIEKLPKRDQDKIYGAHYAQLAEAYLRARQLGGAMKYVNLVRKYHCLNLRRWARFGLYFLRSFK